VLAFAAGVALWRQRAARALFLTAVIFGVLSLGQRIPLRRSLTDQVRAGRSSPNLPLFDSGGADPAGAGRDPLVGC
jgi:hypothetical protein